MNTWKFNEKQNSLFLINLSDLQVNSDTTLKRRQEELIKKKKEEAAMTGQIKCQLTKSAI